MIKLQFAFYGESISTGTDIFVRYNRSQGIEDQKKLSNYVKLGRIPAESIKGWIRHAMEKLLLSLGISVCHPLPSNTMTSDRNKEVYKNDMKLHYHARGECADKDGCIIYNIFGDLQKPGNLIVPSAYFYPTTNGNSILTSEHQKLFGNVGTGRLEISRSSPRARNETHIPFMSTETQVGTMIKAPFTLILREDNEDHETLLLKTLEFLLEQATTHNFDHLLGGKRTTGYGRAAIVKLNKSGNYLTKGRNALGIKLDEVEELNKKFDVLVEKEYKKFPTNGYEKVKQSIKVKKHAKKAKNLTTLV